MGGIRLEGGLGGHSQISPNNRPISKLEVSLGSQNSFDIGSPETSLVGSEEYRVKRD